MKDDPKLYANYASALAAKGNLDEAIANYQRALHLQATNDPATLYALGLAYAVAPAVTRSLL